MDFPSVDLVAQREKLPPADKVTTLKNKIYRTLGALNARPAYWIDFYADNIPDEELALIEGDLVGKGWTVKIEKRFSLLHALSGFPKPSYVRVRG